ncbi:zinc finger protein 185 isoform X2 [Silurus meridionalis]|uniref:zinc finger protein 185 isoform X2 n=1 Tax=Silurus meridionalis TaxID=175797 RepID=UPI001EECD865|nr:zinc finger protein 185 isoform X2 [Silurus meridionalis]
MTTEKERQSVLRTTKVRAALKGDNSWIQLRNQSEPEEDEEKPWLAEVRARRINNDISEPDDDKTSSEQQPAPSNSTDRSKTSGYLIRGVFTKTDTKPAASSSNGYIGTSGFTKKPSEEYKKIAPHTVRTAVERTQPSEPSVSAEEQERRTEAASKTLNNSARKQRSYVMSAAKKYESTPENIDNSPPAIAFIAKRVVISDDDDTGSVQLHTLTLSEEMSVDEPIPPESSPAASESKPRPKPELVPKQSDTLIALSDTLMSTPESISKKPVTQITPPVPETKVSKPEPNPKTSVSLPNTQASTIAPVAALKEPAAPEPKPASPPKPSVSLTNTQASTIAPVAALKEPAAPEPKPASPPKPSVSLTNTQASTIAPVPALKKPATTEPKPASPPKPSATEPVAPAVPAVKQVPSTTPEPKPKLEATPKASIPKPVETTSTLNDNDLLDLSESTPPKLVNPIPTTTDQLAGGSLLKTEKTKESLDLLAVDIIPIDTNTDKLSTNKTNTKTDITQTVVQTKKDVKDVKSTQENLVNPVPTSTDLLIGGTKQNLVNPVPTTTDLLIGGSLPQTKKTSESLDLLAYDVIPIDTNKDKLSTDKTQSKVETTTTIIQTKTVQEGSVDPFDPFPIVKESTKSSVELFDPLLSNSNNSQQQQTVTVTFEQKSSKTSSPWDKWAVPTIDNATEDSEPESEPEPEDNINTVYTRTEESSIPALDTESKKNVVYVKSYVNSSDLPRFSTRRYDNEYDYVTSSSSSYAYSSPSSAETMSACTYCGGLVGNNSKITIDHLNISCHPECFKCGICSKPMGDFIHSMFWHCGMVHCESCYANVI